MGFTEIDMQFKCATAYSQNDVIAKSMAIIKIAKNSLQPVNIATCEYGSHKHPTQTRLNSPIDQTR
jgi:hypothetical protein